MQLAIQNISITITSLAEEIRKTVNRWKIKVEKYQMDTLNSEEQLKSTFESR